MRYKAHNFLLCIVSKTQVMFLFTFPGLDPKWKWQMLKIVYLCSKWISGKKKSTWKRFFTSILNRCKQNLERIASSVSCLKLYEWHSNSDWLETVNLLLFTMTLFCNLLPTDWFAMTFIRNQALSRVVYCFKTIQQWMVCSEK